MLFLGYAEVNEHGVPIKKKEKPKTVALRPGENQHLLALDCREAEKAGYGHSYGKWRAGIII